VWRLFGAFGPYTDIVVVVMAAIINSHAAGGNDARTFFCVISVQSRHADGSLVDNSTKIVDLLKNHQSIGQNVKIVIVARFPVVVSISLDFHGLVVAV
jgi:hypothetical protein